MNACWARYTIMYMYCHVCLMVGFPHGSLPLATDLHGEAARTVVHCANSFTGCWAPAALYNHKIPQISDASQTNNNNTILTSGMPNKAILQHTLLKASRCCVPWGLVLRDENFITAVLFWHKWHHIILLNLRQRRNTCLTFVSAHVDVKERTGVLHTGALHTDFGQSATNERKVPMHDIVVYIELDR